MTVDNYGFGKKVRTLRSQKKLTLQRLAKMTKRSASLLSQIETGKVSPSFSTMRIIADALEISLSQLILEEDACETRDSCLMEVRERKTLTTQGGVQHQLLSRAQSHERRGPPRAHRMPPGGPAGPNSSAAGTVTPSRAAGSALREAASSCAIRWELMGVASVSTRV